MTKNDSHFFPLHFALFLSCCVASAWRHFMSPDETEPPLYQAGYRPAAAVGKIDTTVSNYLASYSGEGSVSLTL